MLPVVDTGERAGGRANGFWSAFAAALLLNGLFVAGDFIETPWALVPAQASIEFIALLAMLAFLAWRTASLAPWARWGLAAIALIGLLVRLADVMVPWFFGRNFNAAVDLKYLPFFLGLLHDALPATTFAAYLAGAAAGGVLALVALNVLIGAVWRAVVARRWSAIIAALGLTAAIFPLAPARYDLGAAPVSAAMADTAWRNVLNWLDAAGVSGRNLALIREALAARPERPSLAGFGGRDVLLIFAESYGAIALGDPSMRGALAPQLARFEARARAAGYHIYSDVLNSPITGGGSWMAHATLLTGIRVDSQPLYDVMLTTDARALGHFFRAAGYRTVAVMPRLQQPWPYGEFFSFDAVLDDAALGYQGPRFAWETTPDQFVLERVHALEVAPARQPLFMQYVLSSSHLPFDHVPPLIADGRRIGDGTIYFEHDGKRYPPPGGQVFDNRDGYLAAIAYVLGAIEDYLVERLRGDALIIIVGDHQPPLTAAASTRNKAVPIHVLSRDPRLVAPFREAGYADGLVPRRMSSDVGMESFIDWLFANFGQAAARDAMPPPSLADGG